MSEKNIPLGFQRFCGSDDATNTQWQRSEQYREYVLSVLSQELRAASTNRPELLGVYAGIANRLLGNTTLELVVK